MNRPEVAKIIKNMHIVELEIVEEANIHLKCAFMRCDQCPFGYCDDTSLLPHGYSGCILTDISIELDNRRIPFEG